MTNHAGCLSIICNTIRFVKFAPETLDALDAARVFYTVRMGCDIRRSCRLIFAWILKGLGLGSAFVADLNDMKAVAI